jgi:methyl-accepting chemotaxis protein
MSSGDNAMKIMDLATINNKFKALAGLVAIVLLAVTLISFVANRFLTKTNEEIYQQSTKGIEEISIIQNSLYDARNKEILAVSYAAVINIEKLSELEKEIELNKDDLLKKISDLKINQKLKDDILAETNTYFSLVVNTFENAKNYVTDEASKNVTENSQVPFRKIRDQFDSLMDSKVKIAHEQNQDALRYASMSRVLLYVSIVIAVVFIVMMLIFSRSIVQPINRMVEDVKNLASGNLAITIQVDSRNELGVMGQELSNMVNNLKNLISSVVKSSFHVATSSEKVVKSSNQIALSAQQQTSAIEETTSSLEASIKLVAKNTEALAPNVEKTSSTINEMATSIENVGKSTELMSNSVEETSATTEQMLVSVEETAKNSAAMTDSVSETSTTVEQMLSSVEQIAKGADSLKNRVVETSGTIEEMTTTVSEVTARIQGADKLSQNAYNEAEVGGKAIYKSIESLQNIGITTEKTMEVIQNLGSRSKEIGSIVEVINEIADQTNLLALNAAIEAARAGDAGRGFAVVAEEIRKLAERSMIATKEIAEVIKQVQKETETAIKVTEETYREGKDGIALAESSRDAFTGIISSVKESSDVIQGIARSASELNKAIDQVMKYVVDMNTSTDRVATEVKGQANVAGSIRNSLENMNKMVGQVNIASKEQAVGGQRIREVLDSMNNIVHDVGIAIKGQVGGAKQIVQAVEVLTKMTKNVSDASADQKLGGENIVKAMKGVIQISADNLNVANDMLRLSEDTRSQVENLQYSVSTFRIDSSSNKRCWDVRNCPSDIREKCPAYNNPDERCWQIEGTYCNGVKHEGDVRTKLNDCLTCDAFRELQGLEK